MVTSAPPSFAEPPSAASGPSPRAPRPKRRGGRVAALIMLVLLAIPAWSLGRVLLADNTDPLGVRVVEWARDHHLGGVVNRVENFWYSHHQPARGGTPKGGIPKVKTRTVSTRGHQPVYPPAVMPFVAHPLAGEGKWQPVGRTVRGGAAAWAAYLRPDPIHTSELVGLVRFDMKKVRATLHEGTELPGGGPWQHGASIDRSDYARVVGAFNSAFKLSSSRGGWFAEGRTLAPLVAGRASLVVYRDGHVDIGMWGRDDVMRPDVVAVRQNLDLLVDNGQLAANLDAPVWGGTLGNAVYVWRSAVCVVAGGDVVYAGGPGLNVRTLAAVMQHAGCRRAMELDINSYWVAAMTFTPDGHGGVIPRKLLDGMQRHEDIYLVNQTRDFVEIDAR